MLKLALLAVALALAPRLPRLRQRYDEAALSPIVGEPAGPDANPALTARLAAWAAEGAGNGATLLPWARPRVPTPLASLSLPAADADTVRRFGYRLAGYHQLDARGRLGGILYRIGVQLRPLAWCLPRRVDEPWDDAWLGTVDDARLAALARWLPRRPTLIVLDRLPQTRIDAVLQALNHAAQNGDQAVRVIALT